MNYPTLLLFLLAAAVSFSRVEILAQVSISPNGADPDPSAMLDIQSTGKGMLIPRMIASQRDAITSPATGLTVFVTTDSSYYYFNGAEWTLLGVRAGALPDSSGIQSAAGVPDGVLYSAPVTATSAYIEVVGNYAFIGRNTFPGSYLDVYNLTDPSNISRVAEQSVAQSLTGMALAQNIAVFLFGSPESFQYVDISNPADPGSPVVEGTHVSSPRE
ncbi:MAG: hypothetical protein U0984_08655, partial [Prosthecobacter sp.]|nr:hypothetical protein [Prosthecobacter sp.]